MKHRTDRSDEKLLKVAGDRLQDSERHLTELVAVLVLIASVCVLTSQMFHTGSVNN